MSLSLVLVLWHTTEFSLLMKHPNVQPAYSIRFDNLLNPELSPSPEALAI
jgi:hypothetical protein